MSIAGYLRQVDGNDMKLLFKWANDPDVRANSFSTRQISLDEHKRWFARVIKDESIRQYIFICDDVPVGQVRYQIDGNAAEVSYSIAKEYRGQGYAAQMLELGREELEYDCPGVEYIIARVKPDNVASIKVFERLDYEKEYIQMKQNVNRRAGEGGISQ